MTDPIVQDKPTIHIRRRVRRYPEVCWLSAIRDLEQRWPTAKVEVEIDETVEDFEVSIEPLGAISDLKVIRVVRWRLQNITDVIQHNTLARMARMPESHDTEDKAHAREGQYRFDVLNAKDYLFRVEESALDEGYLVQAMRVRVAILDILIADQVLLEQEHYDHDGKKLPRHGELTATYRGCRQNLLELLSTQPGLPSGAGRMDRVEVELCGKKVKGYRYRVFGW